MDRFSIRPELNKSAIIKSRGFKVVIIRLRNIEDKHETASCLYCILQNLNVRRLHKFEGPYKRGIDSVYTVGYNNNTNQTNESLVNS